MIRPTALANAVTTMIAGLYIVCAVVSFIAPDFLLSIGQSWIHTVNIELIKSTAVMTFGSFILGLFSISILTWIVTLATASMYRYFVHR